MQEPVKITVRNTFINEKRDLNVYHNATKSACMISFGNAVTIPLDAAEKDDYLHLSIVSGPGNLENGCLVNLPSWCDFTISSFGNGELQHSGSRFLLNFPPGLPVWQLKITLPQNTPENLTDDQADDYISIGEK